MPADKSRMDFSRFPRRDLPKGEPLFLEGEASRQIYLLLAGSLAVYRDDVQVATIDEPLSIVGEISALTRQPRNATVRALRPAKLVVVDDPDRLFQEYPQMGAKLARVLAGRLAAMNQKFVELKDAMGHATRADLKKSAPAAEEKEESTVDLTAQMAAVRAAAKRAGGEAAADAAGGGGSAPASPRTKIDPEMAEILDALSSVFDVDPTLDAAT